MTQFEVASLTDFDRVVTTSSTILDGTIHVDFNGFASANFASTFSLDLFDWATVNSSGFLVGDGSTGDLKILNVDYGAHLGNWDLSQFANTGPGGGVITWVAVPEPSKAMRLTMAAMVFLVTRRSRVI